MNHNHQLTASERHPSIDNASESGLVATLATCNSSSNSKSMADLRGSGGGEQSVEVGLVHDDLDGGPRGR